MATYSEQEEVEGEASLPSPSTGLSWSPGRTQSCCGIINDIKLSFNIASIITYMRSRWSTYPETEVGDAGEGGEGEIRGSFNKANVKSW